MAITKTWGYKAPATTHNVALPDVTKSDYAKSSDKAQDTTYKNITGPIDQQTVVRFATEDVADVYKEFDILPSFQSVSKSGTRSLFQKKDILRVTNAPSSTETSGCDYWVQDCPFKGNITVQVLRSPYVGTAEVSAFLKSLASLLWQSADDENTLNMVLRGATQVLS